jgi:hydroxyacyl-ACP dehydratase HTD2-like protein with hotdog domain
MTPVSSNPGVVFDEVAVGAGLPALVKTPTTIQLFRYSAVTWNAHRIHYEREYAQREGHPDVLVQAHLHGAFLAQLVTDWAGPRARLVSFGWSNRGRAVPGDTLSCTGRVTAKRVEGDRHLVDLELVETNQRSEICAPGRATVALPAARSPR